MLIYLTHKGIKIQIKVIIEIIEDFERKSDSELEDIEEKVVWNFSDDL